MQSLRVLLATGQLTCEFESRVSVAGALVTCHLTALQAAVDVDLGFTPATNLIVIRRLSLKVGQHAEAPAAYLAFPKMRFVKLPQTYRRTGRTAYEYEAPTVGYTGTLHVATSGAILHYPGLFEIVKSGKMRSTTCRVRPNRQSTGHARKAARAGSVERYEHSPGVKGDGENGIS